MAALTIKLEESKTESKAIFLIECSNDIAPSIIKDTEEGFADELRDSGNIIPGENTTKIQMLLQDKDKIDHIKRWLAIRFNASHGIGSSKTSAS